MNILNKARNTIANFIRPSDQVIRNIFNESFYWAVNGGGAEYDNNQKSYIESGYNINPMVYAVINQMSVKTSTVPIYIKQIEDRSALKQLRRLQNAHGSKPSVQQKARELILSNKAFKSDELDFPLERPNANQTWVEFLQLYKTFIRLTGNVYIYMLRVEEGANAGKPMAVYILPSHLMQIVLKRNANLLSIEDPIDYFMLIEGRASAKFMAKDVIHLKYPNPNFDISGSHLYGLSPLSAGLKNIESSNESLNLNIKTMKSGGAFGFIHGKSTPLTAEQAIELKDRLIEMNNDPGDLGKIAGISAEMGFTRMSLTSDELKPFDYLNFDQKQICNVLGWSDALLNNDNGGKYDKQLQERKRVITDNIVPDLEILIQALNDKFLPLFKGYENTSLEFDVMELPEMQDDATLISAWLYNGLDRGVFNRNEVRVTLRYDEVEEDSMNKYTVQNDVIPLDEALNNDLGLGI